MIICDVLQRYYDKQCSHESWSSLLDSSRLDNPLKYTINARFKDVKLAEC